MFFKVLFMCITSFNLQSNLVGWEEQKQHPHFMEEETEAQKHLTGSPLATWLYPYSTQAEGSSQTPEVEAGGLGFSQAEDWAISENKLCTDRGTPEL